MLKLVINVLYFIYAVAEIRVSCQIDASSKTVARQIPYTMTYTKAAEQLVIQMDGTKAPGCETCKLMCTVNRQGMTLKFGRGKFQYQVSATGEIQDQGKTLRLQFDWTEVTTFTKTPCLALKMICSPYCALSRVHLRFLFCFMLRHHKMETFYN